MLYTEIKFKKLKIYKLASLLADTELFIADALYQGYNIEGVSYDFDLGEHTNTIYISKVYKK